MSAAVLLPAWTNHFLTGYQSPSLLITEEGNSADPRVRETTWLASPFSCRCASHSRPRSFSVPPYLQVLEDCPEETLSNVLHPAPKQHFVLVDPHVMQVKYRQKRCSFHTPMCVVREKLISEDTHRPASSPGAAHKGVATWKMPPCVAYMGVQIPKWQRDNGPYKDGSQVCVCVCVLLKADLSVNWGNVLKEIYRPFKLVVFMHVLCVA